MFEMMNLAKTLRFFTNCRTKAAYSHFMRAIPAAIFVRIMCNRIESDSHLSFKQFYFLLSFFIQHEHTLIASPVTTLRARSPCAIFSDCNRDSSYRNKWVVQDSMEVFTLCDYENITNYYLTHFKQKQIVIAIGKKRTV